MIDETQIAYLKLEAYSAVSHEFGLDARLSAAQDLFEWLVYSRPHDPAFDAAHDETYKR